MTTRETISTAGPNTAGVPCRLHSLTPYSPARCGQPVRFVVDVFDLDETPARHVRQFGACDEHADLYR